MIRHTKKLLGAKTLLYLGILYTLIITLVFVAPRPDLPEIDFYISFDKIVHFMIFILLTMIWSFYFFVRANKTLSLRNVILIALVCIIYGIVIEISQQMLEANRMSDMYDVLANSIGTLVGMLLFLNVKKRMIP